MVSQLMHQKLLVNWADAEDERISRCYCWTAENLLQCCFGWIFWCWENRQLSQRCQEYAAAPPSTENREIRRASLWTLSLKDSPLFFSHLWKAVFHFKTLREPSCGENSVHLLSQGDRFFRNGGGACLEQYSQSYSNWKAATAQRWFQVW